jgi:hypothetical protein
MWAPHGYSDQRVSWLSSVNAGIERRCEDFVEFRSRHRRPIRLSAARRLLWFYFGTRGGGSPARPCPFNWDTLLDRALADSRGGRRRLDAVWSSPLFWMGFGKRESLEGLLLKQRSSAEASLVLNAFVLSRTKFVDLLNVGNPTRKAELEERHVLFMEDGAEIYLSRMFARIDGTV